MKVLIVIAALVAAAAARPDVSHLFGADHQHHHHHVHAGVQQAYVKPPAILRQVQETSEQGDYKYSFKTENGIESSGQALLKNAGSKDEALVSEGSYSYVGEDGQTYTVNWVADEGGFRAAGAHIPEIPEEIRKGLEQSANEPEDDGQYREDPNAYDRPQAQAQQVYRRF